MNDQRTISEMGIISDEVYDNDPSGVKYFKDNPETMLVDTHFGITAYTVIDCTSTDTNMQALLLQKSGTNEYVIAFRGTEMETWSSWGGDVLEDLVIGLNNYSSQYSDALDFVQSALNDPKYSEYNITTDNLTLTGHSLGGILTQAVGAVLGIESYAFNPYGTERLLTMPPNIGGAAGLLDVYRYAIFNAFGLDSSYAESAKENVLNIMYSDFGALNGDILSNLATALTSEHLGEMLPIFGDNVGLDGHYISVVNKAIQHYNETLAHFTDTTTMESLSRVYLLSGENGYDKVEAVFTDLNVLGAADHSLSLNILAGTDSEGNSTPLCPDDLETQARSDIAYRYALVNLNPFVVVGADYSSFNQNGELDIYNPGTGQGRLSDEYITHRSEMLSLLIERNINDYSDSSIYFEDKTTGEIVTRPDLNAPLERTVVFGSEQRDELEGSGPTDERPNQGDRDDFLFGMGGNDTLKGYGGDDYLEGGNGEDTLIGGEGNDILDGGQGDDIYRFAPGDGNDTIRDSDGAGTIVITDVAGNIVEIASGDFTRTDSSSDTWTSSSGNITLTQGASWVLTLSDGSTITLETFEDGYFGINLKDVSVSDPTPPQTTLDIIGDYAPVDADPDEEGIQYSYDDLGNVVTDPGSSEEREDVIYDSEGNDFISSGAGDDTIRLKRGGDDVVETGDGDDTVRKSMDGNVNIALGEGDDYFRVYNNSAGQVVAEGGKGRDYLGGSLDNDILIGGTEADCLHGAGGDDLLYGDAQGNAADFIVTGATQEASGTQGELADAEDGNDQIFTGAGDDFITAGDGNDLIVSGGGDDYIRGDGNIYVPAGADWQDWAVTETVTTDESGSTYTYNYSGLVTEGNSGAGNDTIYAGAGNDVVFGESGADTIYLEAGNDNAWGGAGSDTLLGGDGDDLLNGDNGITELAEALHGDDFLDGGDGNDTLEGMGGSDILYGGAGDDTLSGDSSTQIEGGNDYLNGEAGSDVLYGGLGDDTLVGGSGNDSLSGGSGADDLQGGADDDVLYGGSGDDFLSGGTENDDLYGDEGDDVLYGGSGSDRLFGDLYDQTGIGNDILYGDAGDDELQGAGGADKLYGGEDNDLLSGQEGEDLLDGGSGNDELQGGSDNDILIGGSGEDTLLGGSGADDLRGGADDDVLYGGSGNDSLSGGTENDDLYGDEGDDVLYGGSGSDRLFGDLYDQTGIGNDILYGDAGDDELQGAGGADKLYGGEDNDLLFGQEGEDLLDGGSGNDELQGGSDNDILIGGSGEDTLLGGSGADDLRGGADDDVLSGGSGNDFLSGGTENDLLYGDEGDDILYGDAGDDELQGAGGADKLYGGEDNDLLFGQEGEDFLDGGSGNDELQGGSDNDILIGGSGEDTLLGGSGADDLRGGADDDVLSGGSGDDSLSGGTENDLLYGDEGDDILYGGSGSDRLFGDLYDQTGIGNDILYGDAGDDELQGAGGADKLYGGEDNDLLGGQEGEDLLDGGSGNDELQGGADNDILIGGSGDDKLYGDDGNDALVGGAGVDYMVGGKGEDTYSFSLGDSLFNGDTSDMDTLKDLYGQTILEFDETVNLSDLTARFDESQNVYLQYSENDTLKIERGLLYQGILIRIADTEITLRDLVQPVLTEDIDLQGDTFDNTLSGGIGDDTLSGGQGSDTYYYYKDSATDTIIDSTGVNGTDSNTIIFGDGITSEDIHLTLTSSRQLQLIVGNDTANSIIIDNFNADDIYHNPPIQTFIFADGTSLSYEQLLGRGFDLTGDDGADYWLGTNGDDRIIGGKGNDFLSGGAGSDTYFYNLGDGQDIIDNADSDITSVDTLSFGEGINPDDLYLGRSGNDLVVKIGNTTDFIAIHNHFTDGSMDQFVFADGTVWDALGITDQLVKRLTEGTDTYIGSYADEIVQAYGGDDILYGEGGDDSLSGGEGNDFLDGGQGDDLLDGGAGNDILTGGEGSNVLDGGAGDDVYVLMGHNEAGTDIVNDLNPQVTTDVITDSEGIDTVEFGTPEDFMGHLLDYHPGYVSALNIVFCWENGFLTVYYGNEFQNKVTLQDAEVEYFKAADGSIISLEEVEAVLGKIASQLGKPVSDVSAAEIYSNPELTLMIYQAWDRSEVTGEGLHTSEGFEVIGTAESQIIAGRENADGLTGYQGNDLLAGFEGNDVLVGGSGDDVYVFGKGWGHDRVSDSIPDGLLSSSEYYGFFMNRYNLPDDYASDSGGQDTLVFLDDIQLNDLQGYWNGSWQAWGNVGLDDLIIRVGTEGDAVLIADYYAGDIETLRLAAEDRNLTAQDILDLMVTDDADLLRGVDWAENSLAGAGGNDAILGGVLADCLAGGEGEDFLNGGMGDDNYVVSLGDGRDMIKDGNYDLESETYAELRYWKGRTEWVIEYGAYGQQDDFPDEAGDAGGVDSINFGEDIGIQDVAFSRFEYGAYSKFDGLKTYDRLYAGYGPLMEKIAGDSILSALGSADHFNFSQGSDLTSVTNQMAYENDIYLPNQYIEGHAVEDFILTDGSQITFDDINQGLDESAAYIAANQDALTTIEESGRDAKGYVDQILLNKWHRVDQTVNGTASSEQIVAGDGDDTITAGDGADVIDAGFGSDWIDGGSGDDVYIYNRWDGSDTIYDSGGADRLQLGDDIRLDDLIIQLDPATGDLFIGIVDEVEKLTTEAAGGVYEPDVQSLSQKIILKNWSNPDARVETLQLADGTAYNLAELVGGLQVDDYSLSGEEDQLMTGVVAVDSNSNDITFSLSQDATNGTFALNDDGSWTYLPENNYFGYDKVIVEVTDNSGQSVFSQIDLTINPVNDAPIFSENHKAYELMGLMTAEGTVSASDVDGDPLTYSLVKGPDHGQLLMGEDGQWVYQAEEGFSGFDTATVMAVDGQEGSAEQTLDFSVNVYHEGDLTLDDVMPERLLLHGISSSDLDFSRHDSDLEITIRDRGIVTVKNYFVSTEQSLAWLQTMEGQISLSKSSIETSSGGWLPVEYFSGSDAENDLQFGSWRLDVMRGKEGNDILFGAGGIDTLWGGHGSDTLIGGDGNDLLYGDSGNDALYGGVDADVLVGGDGDDLLIGGGGIDVLTAGSGQDHLAGGVGNDILTGGSGDDTYIFHRGDGRDRLYDESGTDAILFDEDVSSVGIALFKADNTLQIGYGIDDVITLNNVSDSTTGNRIEAITLANGSTMTDADINQIIQEMSAYATAEGIAMDSLADVRQNEELMAIVASGWQAA